MMSDNFEKIDLKRAFVSSDPTVKMITPQSGKHAGKETAVAEFNVGKPQWERDEKGDFQQKGTDYHTVRMYGDDAKHIGEILKKGMAVNVEGSKTTESWQKNGETNSKSVINATDVSLNLAQKRIKSIEFDGRERQTTQTKDSDKGKGGKAAEAPSPKSQAVKVKKATSKEQSPER